MSRKGILIISAVTAAALLGLALRHTDPLQLPPVLNLLSVEPVGIFDQAGSEMSLIELNITNPNQVPAKFSIPRGWLFVDMSFEFAKSNRWIRLQPAQPLGAMICLAPRQQYRLLFVSPPPAELSRIRLKCAGAVPTGKSRLLWLTTRLPGPIRTSLPGSLWRWLGFTTYEPSARWHQFTLELLINATNIPPRGI